MSNARLLLVILICGCPALLVFAGPLTLGVVAGVTATGMAMVSWSMRPGEAAFFLSVARPAAILAIIPALWMLVQALPINALAHPIWESVEAAIGHPIAGSISIDTGATLIALGQYLSIAAVGFWSTAVAVDRQRAEWILFSLMAATALIGLLVAANVVLGLLSADTVLRTQAIDAVATGAIIAAAAGVRTLERYETRRASPDRSVAMLIGTFAICAAALAICVTALFLNARGSELIATGYGAATLAAVILIRRLGLGRWGAGAIALLAIILVLFLVADNPQIRAKGFTLSFAEAPSALTSMSQRILDDAPVTGTGAGTFASIAPIYRDVDEQELPATAPTAAATIAIELGWPVLLFVVVITIGAGLILLRAALQRGRDSFYPAAGAGCLIMLLFLCFINAGLSGMAPAVIAAATLGLAFAQRKSRTVQQ